jgi:hypothetical protein
LALRACLSLDGCSPGHFSIFQILGNWL